MRVVGLCQYGLFQHIPTCFAGTGVALHGDVQEMCRDRCIECGDRHIESGDRCKMSGDRYIELRDRCCTEYEFYTGRDHFILFQKHTKVKYVIFSFTLT